MAAAHREDLERRQLTPRALPRVRVTCPLSRVFRIKVYTHGPDVEFLLYEMAQSLVRGTMTVLIDSLIVLRLVHATQLSRDMQVCFRPKLGPESAMYTRGGGWVGGGGQSDAVFVCIVFC